MKNFVILLYILQILAYYNDIVLAQPPCDFSNTFCTLGGNICPNEDLNLIELSGTTFSLLRNFDVISFNDITISIRAEIQGRVAVKNNFNGGANLTIIGSGIEPEGGDISLPYSLVIGNDATFNQGQIFPNGPIYEEDIFVGNQFNSNSMDLQSRRKGACSITMPNCLDQYFENSELFWNQFSEVMANLTDNVDIELSTDGHLKLTCKTNNSLNIVSATAEAFNTVKTYEAVNCRDVAMWVFNIYGQDSLRFTNSPLTTPAPNIFNIIGTNRVVEVSAAVFGSIINPQGSFNQVSGIVYGTVIAKDILNIVQISRPISCVNPISSVLTSGSILSSSSSSPSSSSTSTSTSTTSTASDSTTSSTCVCPNDPSTTGLLPSSTTSFFQSPPTDPSHCPFVDYDNECPGFSFKLFRNSDEISLNFKNYHVISFNNFKAETGDIEGRIAARGSISLGNGYSIGDKINKLNDDYSTFSVIASNLDWESGALFPDGTYAQKEKIYIEGNYQVPNYLKSDIVQGKCEKPEQPEKITSGIIPATTNSATTANGITYKESKNSNENCLEDIFDSAYDCYSNIQKSLKEHKDNANYKVVFSQLKFTCESQSESRYFVTIPASVLTKITWFGFSQSKCNAQAEWVINVDGTDDVYFHGDSFPASHEKVLWNILGKERTIYVNTAVNGGILSPDNYLNQTSGVIRGKVIVGDVILSLQINKPICPEKIITYIEADNNDNNSGDSDNSNDNNSNQKNSVLNAIVSVPIILIGMILVI